MKLTASYLLACFKKLTLKTLFYKNGSIVVSSTILATTIELLTFKFTIPDTFFGISVGLIVILSILIIIDNFTGILASRHEGNKIESSRLFFTFFKFLSAFLFFWLLHEMQSKLGFKISHHKGFVKSFYIGISEVLEVVTYSIFLLLSFREWISIGENIERRFNKKFYLFQIVEKLFDIVEKRFIKWFEDKGVCGNKE